ncbi:Putative HAD-hydrolase yfnB [Mycobacteroides abscessus subsp. abscessus]|nr:Putative HAD-hydrolase yfnB [Mycobacteroides abscessus subsp. abscessus]HEO8422024.1 YjjG family noncanonical pyrimidine nucleotidase [Yersinia enterocolitica]
MQGIINNKGKAISETFQTTVEESNLKNYQTLLFDVDDTLLDFAAAEDNAFRLLMQEQGVSYSEEWKRQYQQLNQGLWKAFEEGKITRDEVVNTRFTLFFEKMGKKVDGALLEQSYREYLGEGNQLLDGAMELIMKVSNHFDLYIVTNGMSATQEKRLKASGLYPFFKAIFVSEDTGYQKPMKEFFDYCFDRIPLFNKETTLIIGDSLSADIQGGYNAGIDTCWINPLKKENKTDVQPTYEIAKLEELLIILEREKQSNH